MQVAARRRDATALRINFFIGLKNTVKSQPRQA
jgi:hypothetical protein